MTEIECVMQCSEGALMDPLDGSTYIPAKKLNDGTKKWYRCRVCGGIFCLDKMSREWQFSAETYTELVEKGLIKDYLKD